LIVYRDGQPPEPPIANITGPKHLQIYFRGVNITFDHNSRNPNGPLQVNWTVYRPDGTLEFFSPEETFNRSFLTAGQRTIRLRVTSHAGLSSEDEVAILVVNSPGIIAYIGKPSFNQIVVGNLIDPIRPNRGMFVNFSADESYVVQPQGQPGSCPTSVTCLAGRCPAETQNSPPSCPNVNNKIPVTNRPQQFTSIDFKWTFDGSSATTLVQGRGIHTNRSIYSTRSNSLNDKMIFLSLNYSSTTVNQLLQGTQRAFTLGNCLDNGRQVINLSNGQTLFTNTTGACLLGEPRVCCPSGMLCQDGNCIIPAEEINRCQDYPNQGDCNNDPHDAVKRDPLYGLNNCNDPNVICSCSWNNTAQQGSQCEFLVERINNTCIERSCTYTYDAGECEGGYMKINVRLVGNGTIGDPTNYCSSGECEDIGERIVPCGRLNFQLSFFDYRQFIAALVIVFVIYLAIHWLRRKTGKTKSEGKGKRTKAK
jgi:hypothetical protein